MRKNVSLILVFLLCLGLCACAEDVPGTTQGGPNHTETDNITASSTDPDYTAELVFQISDDQTYYTVTGINGVLQSPDVVIPAMYQGCPVQAIADNAFEGEDISSIHIPDSVTYIGTGAFLGCTWLQSVNIPEGVTSIQPGTFFACEALTNITIPDSVTSIGSGAFYCCRRLTEIIIPDGVTRIEARAFKGCTGLTSITVPEGVTSIAAGLFDGCTNLISITVHDGVIDIGDEAFYYCASLADITIPNSVVSMGVGSFYGCTGLTGITYTGTLTQWNAVRKGDNWDLETGAYSVYCTDGQISK